MANKLLVEGIDDQHVCLAIFELHRVPETFVVKPKQGIETLIQHLDVEILESGLTRLGIIVDADADLLNRWKQIRAKLKGIGYIRIPVAPLPDGTILEQVGKPRIGVWIMPNNAVAGSLENFVESLVPEGDDLWQDAMADVNRLGDRQRFRSQDVIKAQMYTWLAWQREPGRPMGVAITARYLDAHSSHAVNFISWVTRLFVE